MKKTLRESKLSWIVSCRFRQEGAYGVSTYIKTTKGISWHSSPYEATKMTHKEALILCDTLNKKENKQNTKYVVEFIK